MAKQIFFGNVVIQHSKTKQIQVVEKVVYNENSNINCEQMKQRVSRSLGKQKIDFKILKYCYDTAIKVGLTNY